jgi:hypothetical protein
MSTTHPPSDVPTSSFDSRPRLTSWQRSRLVRSTRKLAKILGETPVPQITLPSSMSLPPRNKSQETIQECPRRPIVGQTKKIVRSAFEPIQAVLRREADGDSLGARSTNSEHACAGTPPRWRDQSPVLFFEVPTHAPVNSRACYSSQILSNNPSPVELGPSFRRRRSSLASLPSSYLKLSPTELEECEEVREARSRRRRLSKLTRHLGESIPPELISSDMAPSKPKSNINATALPPVVPYPSTVHTVAPPLEQGTPFSCTTISSPISFSIPKAAVVKKVDSIVGSIGRSLSQRFNSDVTSSRLLARRLRRSRSETTLSLSHEHITLLRPDTCLAADDHPDTPIDVILGQQSLHDRSHP